jgi:hypothetical protein
MMIGRYFVIGGRGYVGAALYSLAFPLISRQI